MTSHLLSEINPHPRDKNISFVDEGHVYTLTIAGVEYHPGSTTSNIGKFHEHFDGKKIVNLMFAKGEDNLKPEYKAMKKPGMTVDEHKEAILKSWEDNGQLQSGNGSFMHKDIENNFNGEHVNDPDSKEFRMMLDFWADLLEKNPGCKPYRTEWLVYCDDSRCSEYLCGSIDFVVIYESGELGIYDWKRVKQIKKENTWKDKLGNIKRKKMLKPFEKFDDCNFSHYSLQLNYYRHMLEAKYDKKVRDMTLVILHPDQDNYITHNIDKIELNNIWHTLR
jgi:hypothetical protein